MWLPLCFVEIPSGGLKRRMSSGLGDTDNPTPRHPSPTRGAPTRMPLPHPTATSRRNALKRSDVDTTIVHPDLSSRQRGARKRTPACRLGPKNFTRSASSTPGWRRSRRGRGRQAIDHPRGSLLAAGDARRGGMLSEGVALTLYLRDVSNVGFKGQRSFLPIDNPCGVALRVGNPKGIRGGSVVAAFGIDIDVIPAWRAGVVNVIWRIPIIGDYVASSLIE